MTFVASGLDGTVVVDDDKVVVQRKALGGLLRQGAALYKEGPGVLAGALEGPSKQVLFEALGENKALGRILFQAVRVSSSEEESEDLPTGRALAAALRRNRDAVVKALRENDDLVKAWLKEHKDLAGIFLKGDAHIYLTDIVKAELIPVRHGEGTLVIAVEDSEIKVRFSSRQEAEFEAIAAALGSDGEAPEHEVTAAPAAGATKACPMCAEDVKAAAKLCRFCGHHFEELSAPLAG
jgi:hypothetical protein